MPPFIARMECWGSFRRASLSVRITDKNGDPPGAGKIWENRFFTRKMGPHGPENTQIHQSTCQSPMGACQNFFSFTIQAAGVTFPKVIFHLLQKCTKLIFMDFSGSDFIFVSNSISHLPPSPLPHCTALLGNAWSIMVQKKRDFHQNYTTIVVEEPVNRDHFVVTSSWCFLSALRGHHFLYVQG